MPSGSTIVAHSRSIDQVARKGELYILSISRVVLQRKNYLPSTDGTQDKFIVVACYLTLTE